jgi:hypothetical protein
LQSPSVLLTLVYLQLLLERDDAKTLLASAKQEQRDHPEEKLHEHPLTPRLRSGTWEVRQAGHRSLAGARDVRHRQRKGSPAAVPKQPPGACQGHRRVFAEYTYKHVEYCVENDVVQGYDDGFYHPEIVVARDQMAVYVARAFGLLM